MTAGLLSLIVKSLCFCSHSWMSEILTKGTLCGAGGAILRIILLWLPQVSEVKSSYSIRVPYHQAFATTIHLLLLLSSSYPSCIKSSDSSKPWIPMPWIPWRRLLLSDFPWKRAAHHGDLDEAKKLLEKGTRLMAIAKGVGDSFIWPPKNTANYSA